MLAVHTGGIPEFVISDTSRRSPLLQQHEPVPDGIELTDLLRCLVHDGIIDDFFVAGYVFLSAASKSRAPIFNAERSGSVAAGQEHSITTAALSRHPLQRLVRQRFN